MIQLIQKGKYNLVESKNQTKILSMDGRKTFAWVNAKNIGEILVTTHRPFTTDCILAHGSYRLYDVDDEPDFVDKNHLELFVGEGIWQGYLLPTGLPTQKKKRNRIIPTNDIITKTTR